MAAPKRYEATPKGLMAWAEHELEHVGRIVGVKDPDLQYAYALHTLTGMAHLKDALYEAVHEPAFASHKEALLRTHNTVIRVMKHLIKDFDLNLDTVRAFNTRHTLSSFNYLKNKNNTTKKNTKKSRKSRRRRN